MAVGKDKKPCYSVFLYIVLLRERIPVLICSLMGSVSVCDRVVMQERGASVVPNPINDPPKKTKLGFLFYEDGPPRKSHWLTDQFFFNPLPLNLVLYFPMKETKTLYKPTTLRGQHD